MKGLLIKDLKLFQLQGKFFICFVIAIGMILTFINHNATFLLAFLTFVMSNFSLSTISYDEFDNGYAFLFTLPITRKRYIMEKDEERAILISSHISSDLENLCDDLYMIHEGQVIFHEDTDVLLSDYALLKVNYDQYQDLDKQFVLRFKKENYGYSCLTNQKQYYMENYPQLTIEKGTIDNVITMMIRGEKA